MYYVTSSDLKTADAAILARGGLIHGLTLIPAAADCSVVIYDNASTNSGKVLAKLSGLANTAANNITFNHPVCANLGLYADVTGAAAGYIVYYSIA